MYTGFFQIATDTLSMSLLKLLYTLFIFLSYQGYVSPLKSYKVQINLGERHKIKYAT